MFTAQVMITLAMVQLVVTASLAYFLYDASKKYVAKPQEGSELRLPSFTMMN